VAFVAQRRYWSAGDARVIVEAWRRSGESQVNFATRHGVDPKRIGRWAARLARSDGNRVMSARPVERRARGTLRFHPVEVVGARSPALGASAGGSDPAIEIVLVGGGAVRVPPGVAREDLERVLGVLLGVVAAEER
jgi:hypothetical protein